MQTPKEAICRRSAPDLKQNSSMKLDIEPPRSRAFKPKRLIQYNTTFKESSDYAKLQEKITSDNGLQSAALGSDQSVKKLHP